MKKCVEHVAGGCGMSLRIMGGTCGMSLENHDCRLWYKSVRLIWPVKRRIRSFLPVKMSNNNEKGW